jgi:hypothetical protein
VGILIYARWPAAPVPREAVLELACDGEHGGDLFAAPPARAVFDDPSGFVAQHGAAMAAGWLETFRGGERVFLGPCCSGKKPRSAPGGEPGPSPA